MLIYTEDRETFERDIFMPRFALLVEHASYYTRRMDNIDSCYFFETARLKFWQKRNEILDSTDILRVWVEALKQTAREEYEWELEFWCVPFRRRFRGPWLANLVMRFKEP